MSAKQNIIDYLRRKSGGLINISSDMATDIITLVNNQPVESIAVAKLFRWSELKSSYELQYAVPATDELIKQNVKEALTKRPIDKFYLWECYNSAGEFEGKIYTVNTNLF
jgi:hypothetical protein